MSNELEFLARRVAAGKVSRRDFLGRAAALGMSAALANSLVGGAVRAAGSVKGGVLKAGLQGGESTDNLDPAAIKNQVTGAFARSWGEKLIDVDATGNIIHQLAEDHGSSADAKTWTFKIRKDVTFHNGKTLTASDVLATVERHAGPETKSGALGVLRGIDRMKVDGNDFVVSLKEANADLPFLMSDFHLIIQPNGGRDNPQAGVGTGPYRVASHEPGVRALGTRYAGYWDSGNAGYADQVEIIVINDSTARMAALRSGKIHMMNRVEPKIVPLLKNIPGITIQRSAGSGHYVFAMQCNAAPFDNNDLRLALKYAVDRQEMVNKIAGGYGSVGNDFPINKAYPLFADDIEQRMFDPEKAAFHYKKSGHSGSIQFITSDAAFPGAVDAAQLFKNSAAKAGITVDIQRAPSDGYWADVWNKKPFSASFWTGRPTQDQQYSTAYLSGADWNETRFKREDFDALVAAARAELDTGKRKAMYRDIALMVRDDGGAIIPMFNDWVDATSGKVGGYVPHPAGELMDGTALARCWLTV